MKNSNMMWGLIVSFILIFGTAALGHASATMTASPSGNGQFTLQGDGFEGVEGIEVDIQYDKTVLTNPRFTQGSLISGMPLVSAIAKPGCPGLCFAGTYNNFGTTPSSSGPLATISFDMAADTPANVTGSVILKDTNGAVLSALPFSVQVAGSSSSATNNSAGYGSGNGSGNDSGGNSVTTPPPAAGTGTKYPAYLGTVTMPDTGTGAVAKTNEDASPVTPDAEKGQKPATDAAAKETNTSVVAKAALQTVTQETGAPLAESVLERFRAYQGEKSPQSLIELFRSAMAGNSQDPHVALSDGKTTVKVLVGLPATGKSEPEFAFKEAKLVSLNKSGDSTWVVELLPNKGTFEAAVIIMQDGKMAKLPLTVAPPLPVDAKTGKARALTKADFNDFLKQRAIGDGQRSDLNGDGKHDFIDNYIFTANFLVQGDAAKTATEEKPQGAKP